MGSVPGSGRSPGEGNGCPVQSLLPGEPRGQKSQESGVTKQVASSLFYSRPQAPFPAPPCWAAAFLPAGETGGVGSRDMVPGLGNIMRHTGQKTRTPNAGPCLTRLSTQPRNRPSFTSQSGVWKGAPWRV